MNGLLKECAGRWLLKAACRMPADVEMLRYTLIRKLIVSALE